MRDYTKGLSHTTKRIPRSDTSLPATVLGVGPGTVTVRLSERGRVLTNIKLLGRGIPDIGDQILVSYVTTDYPTAYTLAGEFVGAEDDAIAETPELEPVVDASVLDTGNDDSLMATGVTGIFTNADIWNQIGERGEIFHSVIPNKDFLVAFTYQANFSASYGTVAPQFYLDIYDPAGYSNNVYPQPANPWSANEQVTSNVNMKLTRTLTWNLNQIPPGLEFSFRIHERYVGSGIGRQYNYLIVVQR
jgi:hypothetical protein